MKAALFLALVICASLLGCTVKTSYSDSGKLQATGPDTAPEETDEQPPEQAEDVNEQAFYDSPRDITLPYTVNGSASSVKATVYDGFGDYLSGLPKTIRYRLDEEPPTDLDFALMKLDNKYQKEFLAPIVDSIRNSGKTEKEKVLMAISLVQGIPYDFEAAAIENNEAKYPYEPLLLGKGLCIDKSFLLVYLLRELGYGTALLRFDPEQHAAAGIKCADEYDFKDTGYCFIETTAPIIMTIYQGEFANVGELKSEPVVVVVSEGKEFDAKEEYGDAQRYLALREGRKSSEDYADWVALRKKYGLEKAECAPDKILCNGECWNRCQPGQEFICIESGLKCRN